MCKFILCICSLPLFISACTPNYPPVAEEEALREAQSHERSIPMEHQAAVRTAEWCVNIQNKGFKPSWDEMQEKIRSTYTKNNIEPDEGQVTADALTNAEALDAWAEKIARRSHNYRLKEFFLECRRETRIHINFMERNK